MAWTTKVELCPSRALQRGEQRVERVLVGHVAFDQHRSCPIEAASGSTRFFSASP